MQCPVCDERLREVERSGVMIDICPGCKGVWLDRGELEKLLAMAAHEEPTARQEERRVRDDSSPRHEEYHDRESREHGHKHPRDSGHGTERGRSGRRGSWLSDILDGIGGGGD